MFNVCCYINSQVTCTFGRSRINLAFAQGMTRQRAPYRHKSFSQGCLSGVPDGCGYRWNLHSRAHNSVRSCQSQVQLRGSSLVRGFRFRTQLLTPTHGYGNPRSCGVVQVPEAGDNVQNGCDNGAQLVSGPTGRFLRFHFLVRNRTPQVSSVGYWLSFHLFY